MKSNGKSPNSIKGINNMSIDDQLREAISRSGETHYRIAKETGLKPQVIDRFMQGRDIYASTMRRLANHFNLELRMEPQQLWHAIIDAEAEFQSENGAPPTVLRLPILEAYDLAKLGRDVMGKTAADVFRHGIRWYEQKGLPGFPGIEVKIVRKGIVNFEFE